MLKLIVLILIFFSSLFCADHFNLIEKNYLKDKKIIKVCTNPNWEPIEFSKDNTPAGISIDTLKIIEEKFGMEFEFVPSNTWKDSQEMLKKRKCDILPSAVKTPSRQKYALFTDPYLTFHLAIVTRNDKPYVYSLDELSNKVISRKKATGLISMLKKRFPKMEILETSDAKEALEAVLKGDAYYTIVTMPVLSYYKTNYNFDKLHIAGYAQMKYDLCIAVRDDEPILLSIMQKALDSISKQTRNSIYKEWAGDNDERGIDKNTLIKLFIAMALVVFFLLYRFMSIKKYNRRLKQAVNKATLNLNEKNELLLSQQEQLEESLNSFRDLLNTAIEAIIVFDEERKLIDANSAALRIFGFDSKEEGIGLYMEEFIPSYELYKVKKALKEEVSTPYEINLYTKDKKIFPALAGGRYIYKEGKRLRITTIVDLFKVKERDKLLLKQTKLATMGEMINMIAHQWRQPLNIIGSINMRVETLLETGEKLEIKEYRGISKDINRQLEFMSGTIDDFRDFYKPEQEKTLFDYGEIVSFAMGVTKLSNERYNIVVKKGLRSKSKIFAYKGGLKQVLLNLMKNAQDVLVQRGINDPKIEINSYDDEGMSVLEISDNAGGVEDNIIEKIFEPYFTTKDELNGTGLGLYMSKMIVEEHCGGRLAFFNTKDGLSVRIYLKSFDSAD